jgi:1,4-alpha-glucan branching enzyme
VVIRQNAGAPKTSSVLESVHADGTSEAWSISDRGRYPLTGARDPVAVEVRMPRRSADPVPTSCRMQTRPGSPGLRRNPARFDRSSLLTPASLAPERTFDMATLSQTNVTPSTPMGANLVAGGATFRVWAPLASAVYLNGVFGGTADWSKDASPKQLVKDTNGYWSGFLSGVADGDFYKYYVVGPGSSGYKRDAYARELTPSATFPFSVNCIVRSPSAYPWHDAQFVTPDFSNMIIYQLHVGTYASSPPNYGTFLDVVEKLTYLQALGVNVLQPLPVTECEESPSLGYDGADYFSPDSLYTVYDPKVLATHLAAINGLLGAKSLPPMTMAQITSGPDQLRTMVDLCHLHGVAVIFDVVYNHAGGFVGDDESIYFWDREANPGDNNNSLYFVAQGYAGGLAFALWKQPVAQFLIDNASSWLNEFHIDGFRYDEISQLLANNQTKGWGFSQSVTSTVRFGHPRAIQNAEYWPSEYSASVSSIVTASAQGGAGFDVVQHDALRLAVRAAVSVASSGASAPVDMNAIAAALQPSLPAPWCAVTCVENHDIVYAGRDVRIPVLADSSDHQSFYARSRSKLATATLLAAPGIPQIFMGQEFLEDKQWDTNPAGSNLIYWGGLASGNKAMVDQLRFTQDFIRLRWSQPALRGQSIHVFHVHDVNRVIAFHRWVEGQGNDVVVVASFNDAPFFDYQLGFPREGAWAELFNSDVYDNWVNPLAVGNYGGISAFGAPLHGLPSSAPITIPPRALVVFGIS